MQFFGRLHPVLVHLPIGFIVFGVLLLWTDRKKKRYEQVIALAFLWGAISALLASLTGYVHYRQEGYSFSSVQLHLWTGLITTVFCLLVYLRVIENSWVKLLRGASPVALSIVLFLLISVTGHFGGSITHGADFLIEPLPQSLQRTLGYETFEKKEIVLNEENWQQLIFYDSLIDPMIHNYCASCHNPRKAKANLILTEREGILKGGENGEVIVSGDLENSPLHARLILPKSHEDHMPPSGKSQPSKAEINLIRQWILSGNSFEKTLGEAGLKKSELITFFRKDSLAGYPKVNPPPLSPDSLELFKKSRIHISRLSANSELVRVSMVNNPAFQDMDFDPLLGIAQNIAVLDLGGTAVTDSIFGKLAQLPHLTVLKLDNTGVTGAQLEKLQELEYLKSLNLTATPFEINNLAALNSFKSLRTVYLYNSPFTEKSGVEFLSNSNISIEYGNYSLPGIPSDSISY
ncbi:c-type cytochrome domain-containing protein [Poritiphilus flavus]|uniref:Uncharacterized protein n=1 Tax=Poritiphilus flavus TaxID=2697053 RepID=A0A6L9EI99_9FLAO|nr:c-type cytochrome domain-containing protein [Poritiphilus flavus]NAS14385.1 hypothetical protein [Poritiphilus flavus]